MSSLLVLLAVWVIGMAWIEYDYRKNMKKVNRMRQELKSIKEKLAEYENE